MIQTPDIGKEVTLFHNVIDENFEDKYGSLKQVSIGLKYNPHKECYSYIYEAVFGTGPFHDILHCLKETMFRPLTEEELQRAVFKCLSSHADFKFDKKKGKFTKPICPL